MNSIAQSDDIFSVIQLEDYPVGTEERSERIVKRRFRGFTIGYLKI